MCFTCAQLLRRSHNATGFTVRKIKDSASNIHYNILVPFIFCGLSVIEFFNSPNALDSLVNTNVLSFMFDTAYKH